MFDIITFGSATRDLFLRSKKFKIVGEKKFITGKGLCLSLGSKIDVKDMVFSVGGGGTNTAVTFTKQGLKTAYCGMVGKDAAGDDVIKELKKFNIDTNLLLRTSRKPTNHSVILSSDQKERTILVYRGASDQLSKKDIPWRKIKSKWIYLAPLSGKMALLSEGLVNFAKKKGMKVAMNPGSTQLNLSKESLERIMRKVDILVLNQEEASLLTRIPYQKEKEIFKKLDKMVSGICLMTKGPGGAVASDGKYLYRAGVLNIKPVDWTGAGDSFASGFLSGYIKSKGDIVYAMQLGTANGSACLKRFGAKNGLLKKGDKWNKIKVEKESCLFNNHCLPK